MCVVMEGYDTNLLSNFYAYPAFAKKYGHWNEDTNNYQLSAPWQAGLGNAAGVGAFFGTLLNGYLVTKYGHIKVLIALSSSSSSSRLIQRFFLLDRSFVVCPGVSLLLPHLPTLQKSCLCLSESI
jgi:hypothetical protein